MEVDYRLWQIENQSLNNSEVEALAEKHEAEMAKLKEKHAISQNKPTIKAKKNG
jgi:hypothetical protein